MSTKPQWNKKHTQSNSLGETNTRESNYSIEWLELEEKKYSASWGKKKKQSLHKFFQLFGIVIFIGRTRTHVHAVR